VIRAWIPLVHITTQDSKDGSGRLEGLPAWRRADTRLVKCGYNVRTEGCRPHCAALLVGVALTMTTVVEHR